MENSFRRTRHWAVGFVAAATLAVAAVFFLTTGRSSESTGAVEMAPKAVPVSVAAVEPRDVQFWEEFSGRLEAIDRVQIRSRVAGVVESVHFREGARIAKGDLLFTIDPAPYAAEVARAQAQVTGAQARLALAGNDLDRGRKLWDSRTMSLRDLDQRVNAAREAEANLRAAEAALQSAKLNLDYTKIRAPVAGRVGRIDVTVGNLVAAGPSSPALTTLVSVDPVYATFDAAEAAVRRALGSLPGDAARAHLDRVPVEMLIGEGEPRRGHLQLIDNQIAAGTGTVRLRAIFSNKEGGLMPGQFARLRLGRAVSKPVLMVSERAVGTDQDKRFVLVVGADNKLAYREVTLGATVDSLRVVTDGLTAGERVVVNGLQRVRPGALVAPQTVSMSAISGARVAEGR